MLSIGGPAPATGVPVEASGQTRSISAKNRLYSATTSLDGSTIGKTLWTPNALAKLQRIQISARGARAINSDPLSASSIGPGAAPRELRRASPPPRMLAPTTSKVAASHRVRTAARRKAGSSWAASRSWNPALLIATPASMARSRAYRPVIETAAATVAAAAAASEKRAMRHLVVRGHCSNMLVLRCVWLPNAPAKLQSIQIRVRA